MGNHPSRGRLRSIVIMLGIFAVSTTLGAWRALAQDCGIPGAGGSLLGCYGAYQYCGDGTYCIRYNCSGLGFNNCGENSGEECTFDGLCEQIGIICSAPC